MNKLILMGRLTRDPEARYTQSGKAVTQFTLAVDRPFSNQDGQREADFINIVVWGKIAELCGNSLTKGQRALVEGRLQIRSYEAKEGGKRWITEVIANHVEFIEPKDKRNVALNTNASGPASTDFGSMGEIYSDEQFAQNEIPF